MALNVKIASWKEDKKKPVNLIWQGIVGFFVEVFTNQKKDQFATKIELTGDLNNVKTKVWPTVASIFKNAFVGAFQKNTDNTITFTPRIIQPTKKEMRKSKRAADKKKQAK